MGQSFFLTGIMVLFLAYTVFVVARRKAASPAALRAFFERTGYRYVGLPAEPLEAHLAHNGELMKRWRQGAVFHMVRDFHGVPIHHYQELGAPPPTAAVVAGHRWSSPLASRPRCWFQIFDRKVADRVRSLAPHTFSPVSLGDPQLDKRFIVLATDVDMAKHLIHSAGLIELLLPCAEVDLFVDDTAVTFADPRLVNIMAASGGTLGGMAMATDPGKQMDLLIPLHDHIAQVLATVVRAVA